ncbi:MAG: hypothetical protein MRJ93_09545 [Nitrososphaeraceae archaeon]|nr:hypothetical protein [Nitrososphaeraceae archaeon]
MSDHNNGHRTVAGFLDDKEIEEILEKRFKVRKSASGRKEHDLTEERLKMIEKWYKHDQEHPKVYRHHDPIGPGIKNCNEAVSEYMNWIAREQKSTSSFTNKGSYRDENSFIFKRGESTIYFATVSPFQDPYDFRDINLTEPNDGLLIATFMSMESPQFYSLIKDYTEKELLEFILQDTAGIFEIEAYLDDEPINGCTVIQSKFQTTTDIPKGNIMNVKQENMESNNSINQLYLWIGLALKPKFINQGDHLLEFKVNSKNYRINAKLQISGMVGVSRE